eukprot:Tamp_25503.p1 GENE.Tamp_25503~~Tamp_25503.p1  ORF type:complete len:212 (+),score=8.85 Tamp_25503:246-881(+)
MRHDRARARRAWHMCTRGMDSGICMQPRGVCAGGRSRRSRDMCQWPVRGPSALGICCDTHTIASAFERLYCSGQGGEDYPLAPRARRSRHAAPAARAPPFSVPEAGAGMHLASDGVAGKPVGERQVAHAGVGGGARVVARHLVGVGHAVGGQAARVLRLGPAAPHAGRGRQSAQRGLGRSGGGGGGQGQEDATRGVRAACILPLRMLRLTC